MSHCNALKITLKAQLVLCNYFTHAVIEIISIIQEISLFASQT